MLYMKNESCMLVGPGKWRSEREEASTHMSAHVFPSKCMHAVCRHIGMTRLASFPC